MLETEIHMLLQLLLILSSLVLTKYLYQILKFDVILTVHRL